ncbi:MAG: helix-turn-helix domain-containing protein, partial [Candidatus Methylomirabilota bacterium]
MSRHAPPIMLSPNEVVTLETWARSRTLPARVVERAQIVHLAAHGVPNQAIAQRLGVSRPTVQLWRERFLA